MLRQRLEDGDLQAGDAIILAVEGEQQLTDSFKVSAARSITLPGIADISMRGVLRSEVEEYLTRELRKYLRNPVVHVQTTVRLSILGSVGKPGYYQVNSERMIGDAIMLAGGPAGGIDPAKTYADRGGVVILDREAFSEALDRGKTLDQMNFRAGDEIVVGGARTGASRNVLGAAVPILGGLSTLTFLLTQIF